MSQTYMTHQRRPAEVSEAVKTAAPPAADMAGGAMLQRSLDAIRNVEPHAGRRLNLDEAMAARMQQQFGIRMDQVELRESSQAADMDARAFAKGNVVQFAPGQFQPDTEQGRHLIEHELSHVAQQARGGVRADVPGLNVNANEGLEHQADMGNMTASFGAPASLSGISAEAAPVQGAFGRIKNFFRKRDDKIARSENAGRALARRDQVVKDMTAEHKAEQAEIIAAMEQQGYSEAEIQAQLMFQRINQNDSRGARYQDAQAEVFNSGLEDPSELDNYHARSARGTFWWWQRNKRARREKNFTDNILAGYNQMNQANEMTSALTEPYESEAEALIRPNALHSIDEAVKDDTAWKNKKFKAAMARYNAKNKGTSKVYDGTSGDVRHLRFLQRHMTGTDKDNDALFAAVLEHGDQAMMPMLREDANKLMNLDFSVLGTGEDGVSANADSVLANPQQAVDALSLNSDLHNFSDLIGSGRVNAQSLGYTDEEFAELLDRKKKFATQAQTIRRPILDANRAIEEASPMARGILANKGALTGLENGRTRAEAFSKTAPEKLSFWDKIRLFGG